MQTRDARSVRRFLVVLAICAPAIASASILVTPNSSSTFSAQVGQTSGAQSFTVEETRRLVGDNDETVTLSYAGACGEAI